MTKEILIFDNYDSFTYNLCNLLKSERAEYNYKILRKNDKEVFTTKFDVLIISPGPMTPDKTGNLKKIFETKIIPGKIPTLGICLGMQFIAQYFNALVEKSNYPKHGIAVNIEHSNKDIFNGIPNYFKIARYNSLEVSLNSDVKNKIEVLAYETGNDAIMALRHKHFPFVGLQFHPESFLTEYGNILIDNFFKIYVEN
ncbi:MAG: aminodeoxychorismate/anthranilate synthase component II [Bacteroidales bacterium]|nr:aminodeoxychorismate/anthranilate synthase component II [Bacteroidales bacterium]